jgi:hypothetical protein
MLSFPELIGLAVNDILSSCYSLRTDNQPKLFSLLVLDNYKINVSFNLVLNDEANFFPVLSSSKLALDVLYANNIFMLATKESQGLFPVS